MLNRAKTKHAFTMIELIFVLVVVGILAAIITPHLERNPLYEAGIQLVSHIRYTQHLAMVNDVYDSTDNEWYKNRWQIMFEKSAESDKKHSYTIFSDWRGKSTGNADAGEIAINPEDTTKNLTGGTNGVKFKDKAVTPSMNLGNHYGITDLKVTGGAGTTTNAKRVAFDNLGRPYKKNSNSISSITNALAITPIYIKICLEACTGKNNLAMNDNELVIRIENETGYACILQQNTSNQCLD